MPDAVGQSQLRAAAFDAMPEDSYDTWRPALGAWRWLGAHEAWRRWARSSAVVVLVCRSREEPRRKLGCRVRGLGQCGVRGACSRCCHHRWCGAVTAQEARSRGRENRRREGVRRGRGSKGGNKLGLRRKGRGELLADLGHYRAATGPICNCRAGTCCPACLSSGPGMALRTGSRHGWVRPKTHALGRATGLRVVCLSLNATRPQNYFRLRFMYAKRYLYIIERRNLRSPPQA